MLEAIASRLEAIALKLEAIASRSEAIAISVYAPHDLSQPTKACTPTSSPSQGVWLIADQRKDGDGFGRWSSLRQLRY